MVSFRNTIGKKALQYANPAMLAPGKNSYHIVVKVNNSCDLSNDRSPVSRDHSLMETHLDRGQGRTVSPLDSISPSFLERRHVQMSIAAAQYGGQSREATRDLRVPLSDRQ